MITLNFFNFVECVVCHCAVCDSGIISCCILDSATVQGKGVSANADAVVVERICILYRVLENQRSISAARRISCRSVSAAYNNGELLECQNTI